MSEVFEHRKPQTRTEMSERVCSPARPAAAAAAAGPAASGRIFRKLMENTVCLKRHLKTRLFTQF